MKFLFEEDTDNYTDYYIQYLINHENLEKLVEAYAESSFESQFFFIEYTIRNMKKDFIKWLLSNEASVTESYNTNFLLIESIFLGIRTGEIDIINDLLKVPRFGSEFVQTQITLRKQSFYYFNDPFTIPSSGQMLTVLKLLNKHGINFNIQSTYDNETALHIAAKYKKLEVVQYLLEKGVDSNAKTKTDGYTALHLACINVFQNDQSEGIVQILIQYGSDMYLENKCGVTPFCVAICNNSVKCVEIFLKLGYIVNFKNKYGKTALFYACRTFNAEIVKLLLKNKARVDINDYDNLTLLHYIAGDCGFNQFHGNKIAKYLLNNCKDLDVNILGTLNSIKTTALHLACKNENLNLAKMLLHYNANVNIKNSEGDTSLLISIQSCKSKRLQIEFFNVFIKEGSSIYEKNNKFETLFYFACQKGNIEIVEYLLKRGISVNDNEKFKSSLYLAASASNENFDEKLIYLLLFYGANLDSKFFSDKKNNINAKGLQSIFKYLVYMNEKSKITDEYSIKIINSVDINYKKLCEKELTEMKNLIIFDNCSLFSFFIKSIDLQAEWLLLNSNRKQTLCSLNKKTQFPEYWNMFEVKVKAAIEKTAYLDLAILSLENLFQSSLNSSKILKTPDIVMKIINYLSLMDLKNLSSVSSSI